MCAAKRAEPGPLPTLPGVLEKFRQDIGDVAAAKLLIHFAGQTLHVPHRITDTSELATVVGDVAARILSKRHGGITYHVPAARRERIILLLQEGQTREEIAGVVGCAVRYVYKVQKEFLEAGGQITAKARRRVRRKSKSKKKKEQAKPRLPKSMASAPLDLTVRPQLDLFITPFITQDSNG